MRGWLIVLLLSLSSTAYSESGPLRFGEKHFTQEMETDRPDFTEGTQTIDAGHLQWEMGYTLIYDEIAGASTTDQSAPELLMRVGLIEEIELRLGWAGVLSTDSGTRDDIGVSDLSIGFKKRLLRQRAWIPDGSLIFEISLPVGMTPFSAEELVPTTKLVWAYGFGRIGIAGNLNFSSPVESTDRIFEIANTFTVGFDITESIGSYVEYFGFFPMDNTTAPDTHFIDGGLTWGATENLQFDIRAGGGLNTPAENMFTGVGLAYRI